MSLIKTIYQPPVSEVFSVMNEGVICVSIPQALIEEDLINEDFNA